MTSINPKNLAVFSSRVTNISPIKIFRSINYFSKNLENSSLKIDCSIDEIGQMLENLRSSNKSKRGLRKPYKDKSSIDDRRYRTVKSVIRSKNFSSRVPKNYIFKPLDGPFRVNKRHKKAKPSKNEKNKSVGHSMGFHDATLNKSFKQVKKYSFKTSLSKRYRLPSKDANDALVMKNLKGAHLPSKRTRTKTLNGSVISGSSGIYKTKSKALFTQKKNQGSLELSVRKRTNTQDIISRARNKFHVARKPKFGQRKNCSHRPYHTKKKNSRSVTPKIKSKHGLRNKARRSRLVAESAQGLLIKPKRMIRNKVNKPRRLKRKINRKNKALRMSTGVQNYERSQDSCLVIKIKKNEVIPAL